MKSARRGLLYGVAAFLAVAPFVVWISSILTPDRSQAVVVPLAFTSMTTPLRGRVLEPATSSDSLLALGQRDPLALVRLGYERWQRELQDYRCTLLKQERIAGVLSPVERVEVRFRKSPEAIYMIWRENPSQVKRALFRGDDPAYVDENGKELARVEPAGAVINIFVKNILMPIKGERARSVSRRTIDECSFGAVFELFEQYSERARNAGVLDVRWRGTGEVGGRPTYVIERHLPYSGEGGRFPDALLIMHLDQEWLLPVAVESFADPDGAELLGRYVFKDIERNPGLTDQDFEF